MMRVLSFLTLSSVAVSNVLYASANGVGIVHPTGHETGHRTLQASGSDDEPTPSNSPVVNPPTPPIDPTPPPSYEDGGKGGKGGKGSKDSKSSKSAKSDSSSKSSKGSKSAKSGKGGKGGKGGSNTPAPTPSGKGSAPAMPPSGLTGSSDDMPARPPITFAPASMPSVLPPSSSDNLQAVSLSRYAVAYTLGSNSMPMRDDYLAVGETTATYFEGYMVGRYQESDLADLVKFETTINMTFFMFGEPALIEYESTAYFSEGSTVVPRPSVLDMVLMEALNEPEPYIDLLAGLGSSNPFSTTTGVEFKEPETRVVSARTASAGSTTSSNTSTFAVGAAGLGLLLAGAVLYKRKRGDDNGEYLTGKRFAKNRDSDEVSTLAGETYAGETFDGSISMDRSTYLADDEEHGMENVDLESSEAYFNGTSIAPVWEDERLHAEEKAPTTNTGARYEIKRANKAQKLEKANSAEEVEPILGESNGQTSAKKTRGGNRSKEVNSDMNERVEGQLECDSSETATRAHESLASSIDRAVAEEEPFSIEAFEEFLERESHASSTSSSGSSYKDVPDMPSKTSWEEEKVPCDQSKQSNRPTTLAEVDKLLQSDI